MRRLATFGLLLAMAVDIAWADEFYEIVRLRCDAGHNVLRVSHVVAYNEKGRELLATMGQSDWNPWQMLTMKDRSSIVVGVRSVRRTCPLSDGTYQVTITPAPCNSDLLGLNGGMMRVNVTVRKDERRMAFARFGYCTIADTDTVTTAVSVSPGKNRPLFVRKKVDDFFRAE